MESGGASACNKIAEIVSFVKGYPLLPEAVMPLCGIVHSRFVRISDRYNEKGTASAVPFGFRFIHQCICRGPPNDNRRYPRGIEAGGLP